MVKFYKIMRMKPQFGTMCWNNTFRSDVLHDIPITGILTNSHKLCYISSIPY